MKLNAEERDDGVYAEITCNIVARTSGKGLWSTVQRDVAVTSIGMFLSNDGLHGDVGIYYDEATWNDARDGLIYTDEAFLEAVQKQLETLLGAEAAHDFWYSECGMQDDGRVSCDAGGKLIAKLHELALAELTT